MGRLIRKLQSLFTADALGGLLAGLGPGFAYARGAPGPVHYLLLSERAGAFALWQCARRGQLTWEDETPLLNGRPFHSDLPDRAVQESDRLRQTIHAALGLTVWVTPVIVFPYARVQPGPPLLRVQMVDRAYLTPLLKMPRSANPAHALLWENRALLFQNLKLKE